MPDEKNEEPEPEYESYFDAVPETDTEPEEPVGVDDCWPDFVVSEEDPLPVEPEDDPVPDVPVDEVPSVPVEGDEDDPPVVELPVLEPPCVPDVVESLVPDEEESWPVDGVVVVEGVVVTGSGVGVEVDSSSATGAGEESPLEADVVSTTWLCGAVDTMGAVFTPIPAPEVTTLMIKTDTATAIRADTIDTATTRRWSFCFRRFSALRRSNSSPMRASSSPI